MTDQVSFERIRSGTDNFNTDWLTAMTEEEQFADNLIITFDIHKNQKGFSDVLSKHETIDMIAHRYKLKSEWVDGKYCILFKLRPPMYWDSQLLIWKFGTMSQMVERQISGNEVCVVCTKSLVRVHRVSQDGPPPSDSHFFYLPWQEVIVEQEMIVKKMMTHTVFGLNRYNLVEEILECPEHGDAFKTGSCAAPWCIECRKLFASHSKQKPGSTTLVKPTTTRRIPD